MDFPCPLQTWRSDLSKSFLSLSSGWCLMGWGGWPRRLGTLASEWNFPTLPTPVAPSSWPGTGEILYVKCRSETLLPKMPRRAFPSSGAHKVSVLRSQTPRGFSMRFWLEGALYLRQRRIQRLWSLSTWLWNGKSFPAAAQVLKSKRLLSPGLEFQVKAVSRIERCRWCLGGQL